MRQKCLSVVSRGKPREYERSYGTSTDAIVDKLCRNLCFAFAHIFGSTSDEWYKHDEMPECYLKIQHSNQPLKRIHTLEQTEGKIKIEGAAAHRKRNWRFKFERSIVSISITSIFPNPESAWRVKWGIKFIQRGVKIHAKITYQVLQELTT